jgi:hypothetical protein
MMTRVEIGDMLESVLDNVEWDRPPTFPRRPADDLISKELLGHTITNHKDP